MFKNKHIVITGGSSGLGLELARRLIKQGAKLTLVARNQKKLARAQTALRLINIDAEVYIKSIDVSDDIEVVQGVKDIAERFSGIDVLINNAGVLKEGTIETLSIDDYRQVMEVNYFGVVNMTKAALPYLIKSRGRVVNIASVAGLTTVYGYSSYASSKHALVGFTETIRYELKPQGVTVQLVCPGEFESPMVDELNAYRTEENKAHTQTLPPTSVEKIAESTLNGMRSNRFMILPGLMTKSVVFGAQHLRSLMRFLGDRIIASVQHTHQ